MRRTKEASDANTQSIIPAAELLTSKDPAKSARALSQQMWRVHGNIFKMFMHINGKMINTARGVLTLQSKTAGGAVRTDNATKREK